MNFDNLKEFFDKYKAPKEEELKPYRIIIDNMLNPESENIVILKKSQTIIIPDKMKTEILQALRGIRRLVRNTDYYTTYFTDLEIDNLLEKGKKATENK